MPYTPLSEDPAVPAGSFINAEVVVTSYFTPTGALKFRCSYEGAVPLSTVLGLLALAQQHLIARCEAT